METEAVSQHAERLKILWAEDNPVLQKTIPVDFKNAINEHKLLITQLLNIEFQQAKLDIQKNQIDLYHNNTVIFSFHLDLAINGKIAIEKFYKNSHSYTFLLFDELMPLVNGSEAIAVIRDKNPNILIISWSDAESVEAEIINAGANKFFHKQSDLKPLIIEILQYALHP